LQTFRKTVSFFRYGGLLILYPTPKMEDRLMSAVHERFDVMGTVLRWWRIRENADVWWGNLFDSAHFKFLAGVVSTRNWTFRRWIAIAKVFNGVKTLGSAVRILVYFLLSSDGHTDAQLIHLHCHFWPKTTREHVSLPVCHARE